MAELTAQTPEGIRVILNEADVTDIQAVIEGPGNVGCLSFSLLASSLFGLVDKTDISEQSILLSTIHLTLPNLTWSSS